MKLQPLRLEVSETAWFRAIWCLFLVGVVLLLSPPWYFELPGVGLDPSWRLVVSLAADAQEQWGSEFAFTYGPLSELATHLFSPERAPALLLLRSSALIISFGAAFWLCHKAGRLYTFAAVVVLAVTTQLVPDAALLTFATLFVLVYFGHGRGRVALSALLIGTSGALPLVKLSFAMPLIAVAILADLDRLRERKAPLFSLLLLSGFIIAYLSVGQRLESLLGLATSSLEIFRGYSEAMSLRAMSHGSLMTIVGAIGITALVIAFIEWKEKDVAPSALRRLLLLSSLLAIAFFAFKAGYVREDVEHRPITWSTVGLLFVLYIGSKGEVSHSVSDTIRNIIAISALLSCSHVMARLVPMSVDRAAEFWSMASEWSEWIEKHSSEYAASLNDIKSAQKLPNLEGPVGSLVSMQSTIIANGLDFRSFPVPQEYAVYTPKLAELNLQFLLSERRPRWLFVPTTSIDFRWPSSATGALLPSILDLYEVAATRPGVALMVVRENPRLTELRTVARGTHKWSKWIEVPADCPLYMRASVIKTLAGRLATFIYYPPMIYLEAETRGGLTIRGRVIPGIFESGLLISPLLMDSSKFASLEHECDGAEAEKIVRLRFLVNGHMFGAYEPDIAVEFKMNRTVSAPAG